MSDDADQTSTTDKGRPRTSTPPPPPSADEYARTTKGSADSTAVIPAVDNHVGDNGVVTVQPEPDADSRPRHAVLRLTHVDPWSVTRMAFVVSVAMMIVAVVATVIFWMVLNALGVWDQISDSVTSVLSDAEDAFDITDYLGMGRLVGLSLLLSVVNVVAMTVLATIAAHLYNLAAHVLGGFQVTFTNDE